MAIEAGETTYYQAKRGIVQDGLVLNLDAAVDGSFPLGNDAENDEWIDLTGNCKAVFKNQPVFDSVAGGYLKLDGTDDYLELEHNVNGLLRLANSSAAVSGFGNFTGADTNNYSVMAWIKSDDTSNTSYPAILGRDAGDIYASFGLRNGYLVFLHYNGSWIYITSTTLVSDGSWHHVAYVNHSDETGDLYVDGVAEVTGASSSINLARYYKIDGIGRSYFANYLQMDIASLQVYDIDLNSDQILRNYNATRHRFGV